MTDREKITEILKAYTKKHNIMASSVILEEYAEELVKQGVIVPPCKVGDMVYVIEPCTCYSERYRQKCQTRCNDNRKKCLKIVPIKSKKYPRPYKCLKLFERGFRIEYLHKIGKTVFLTKKEALEKLKEFGK